MHVTNSVYSPWDNQFHSEQGSMRLDLNFYVDFSPARAHEMRLPSGDPTTEIWQ